MQGRLPRQLRKHVKTMTFPHDEAMLVVPDACQGIGSGFACKQTTSKPQIFRGPSLLYCQFRMFILVMRASRASLAHCQLAAWQAFAVGRELPGVSQPNIAAM